MSIDEEAERAREMRNMFENSKVRRKREANEEGNSEVIMTENTQYNNEHTDKSSLSI